MPMLNLVQKACVFASFLVAGSSLMTVSAEAHLYKAEHHLHAASVRRHETARLAHVSRHQHLAFHARGRHGRSEMERVTYTTHRHGKTYLHTVWRPRDHGREAGSDALYSSGVYRGGWMECVPYARRVSGIELTGDAYVWWNEAAGRYQRGDTPASGSVLSFRSNGRMRLGHVAVGTEVVNRREIVVTQANWGGPGFVRGGVSSGISVVDVSPDNDWTAVRVALGHSSSYGSVYPTYGFIYGHDAPATVMADAGEAAPQILQDRPPADLRSVAERGQGKALFRQTIEFAAAPSFSGPAIQTNVPDRSIR
jgi:surface antigen